MKRKYFARGLARLQCLFKGHRDLARADAYGEELPERGDYELHYCGNCGGPVWVKKAHQAPPTVQWKDCGLAL